MDKNSLSILATMRHAKMPTGRRKHPPSMSAMRECGKVCVDLKEAATWFNVPLEMLGEWLREKPELGIEFNRMRLQDLLEIRCAEREAVMAGKRKPTDYVRMTFPHLLQDKAQVHVTTELKVLPTPSNEPLVIEGEVENA